jgi:NhaC family Na+:H+ antiporter
VEYLPFAFFNLINPLLAIIFGFAGFRVEHSEPGAPQDQEPAAPPGPGAQPDAA